MARRPLGAAGESFVADRLRAAGFELLARNFRSPRGEIDLIAIDHACDPPMLVFCEVKTRRSAAFGRPGEAVGWEKQRRIRAVAADWFAACEERPHLRCRFDVAEVLTSGGVAELNLIRDAF